MTVWLLVILIVINGPWFTIISPYLSVAVIFVSVLPWPSLFPFGVPVFRYLCRFHSHCSFPPVSRVSLVLTVWFGALFNILASFWCPARHIGSNFEDAPEILSLFSGGQYWHKPSTLWQRRLEFWAKRHFIILKKEMKFFSHFLSYQVEW